MFTPKSYREMLTKLNLSTAILTFIYVAAITRLGLTPQVTIPQDLVPPVEDYQDLINWATGSFGLVPLLSALAALVLSWTLEMHNIVSKAVQLRFFWDKYFIVKPLHNIANSQACVGRDTVRRVMNDFYYPALKTIDPHYVEVFWRYALVFWILFEHLIVVASSIVVLVCFRTPHAWKLLGYFLPLLAFTALQFFLVTVNKTRDQVRQIPVEQVREYFRTGRAVAR